MQRLHGPVHPARRERRIAPGTFVPIAGVFAAGEQFARLHNDRTFAQPFDAEAMTAAPGEAERIDVAAIFIEARRA